MVKKKGKPGRKGKDWMPLDEVRVVLADEDIGSRAQYARWWELNKPNTIPKYPNRVYKDWIGWNDYLGNDNVAAVGVKRWRKFEEAMSYIHTMNINSVQQYNKMHKDGEIPDDIPSNPQLVYERWATWSHFLGSKVMKRVEAVKMIKEAEVGLLVVCQYKDRPGGVYGVFVVRGGRPELDDIVSEGNLVVMKAFKLEEGYDWKAEVGKHGHQWNDWQARNNEYLIPNVNQLVFELSCSLLFA